MVVLVAELQRQLLHLTEVHPYSQATTVCVGTKLAPLSFTSEGQQLPQCWWKFKYIVLVEKEICKHREQGSSCLSESKGCRKQEQGK